MEKFVVRKRRKGLLRTDNFLTIKWQPGKVRHKTFQMATSVAKRKKVRWCQYLFGSQEKQNYCSCCVAHSYSTENQIWMRCTNKNYFFLSSYKLKSMHFLLMDKMLMVTTEQEVNVNGIFFGSAVTLATLSSMSRCRHSSAWWWGWL